MQCNVIYPPWNRRHIYKNCDQLNQCNVARLKSMNCFAQVDKHRSTETLFWPVGTTLGLLFRPRVWQRSWKDADIVEERSDATRRRVARGWGEFQHSEEKNMKCIEKTCHIPHLTSKVNHIETCVWRIVRRQIYLDPSQLFCIQNFLQRIIHYQVWTFE